MGGVPAFELPLRELPDGQLPSLNMGVEMGRCGPLRISSSVPFGVSGAIQQSPSAGLPPVFGEHTLDQWELYRAPLRPSWRPAFPFRAAPLPRRASYSDRLAGEAASERRSGPWPFP